MKSKTLLSICVIAVLAALFITLSFLVNNNAVGKFVDPDGNIDLTEKGLIIAKRVYERHEIIASALEALGVSRQTALDDSCKIEHVISEESFLKIKEFLNSKNK